MGNKLRIGILTTGNIARQFATGVNDSSRCSLAAVGSRNLDSARDFAQTYGAGRAHGAYDDLIADNGVDAIYIGLPNSMHHEYTLKALRAGKHVLCEKPLASNAREAEEMFAAADTAGRMLVEAFMYRAHPQTLAVVDAVRSGVIGQIRMIRTSFCYRTRFPTNNIRFDAELAGGALMDIGCYCLDFSQLIAGGPPVSASAAACLHTSGVDEMAAGFMTFPKGILASFTCGMTAAVDNAAFVCGTEGYITVPVPWKASKDDAHYVISRGTPPKMDVAKGAVQSVAAAERVPVPAGRDLYSYEADAFAAAIAGEAPPHMPREASLSNMRLLDQLRQMVGVRVPARGQ